MARQPRDVVVIGQIDNARTGSGGMSCGREASNGIDSALAPALDENENVFIAGYSFTAGAGKDYVIIKYSSSGVQQWVKVVNGPGNGDDVARDIAVDVVGDAYVTGSSNGAGPEADVLTMKYSSDGDSIWAIGYNGPGNGTDMGLELAVGKCGDVFVTGESAGLGTGTDAFLIKYSQQLTDGDGDGVADLCDTLVITVYSPVDIIVTSPNGLDSIGPSFNTFGSTAGYIVTTDFGVGPNGIIGELDDRVWIKNSQRGSYLIRIIPEPDADTSDNYFLGIRDPGGNVTGDGWVAMTGANAPFISLIPVANPVPQPNEEHVTYVGGLCDQRRGDMTGEGVYDVLDVIQVINVAFRGQTAPDPAFIADANSDGIVSDVLDVVRIIGHVFRGAPEPGP